MRKYIWVIALLISGNVCAQDTDSAKTAKKDWLHILIKENYGKNVIKYNVMPTMIFAAPQNATFSYERITWPGQSVSLGGGYLTFPNFMSSFGRFTDVTVTKNAGFTGTFDYRFYLKKHNKRPAPNGVYIGPFYSIYNYSGAADFVYNSTSDGGVPAYYKANLQTDFVFHNIGFQLGYQFIFFKRLTLDMVLCGPAVSFYDIELDAESNLSPDEKSRLYRFYKESFLAKTPIFSNLMERANFDREGVSTGYVGNFRYTFQIGWHF